MFCVYICCLSGVPSLAEQCKAVIMSTLVELDSVREAEQLSERLPDHVPPRIKLSHQQIRTVHTYSTTTRTTSKLLPSAVSLSTFSTHTFTMARSFRIRLIIIIT